MGQNFFLEAKTRVKPFFAISFAIQPKKVYESSSLVKPVRLAPSLSHREKNKE
jgi:hypothetical protein